MTKDELKNDLAEVHARLAKIEDAARTLVNQNFADIAARAKGCIHQLANHPDFELAHEKMEGKPADDGQNPNDGLTDEQRKAGFIGKPGEPPPFDPNAGSAVGGPDRGKPDVHVPGEPRFEPNANNPNFQQPNAVDLNADGTLRQAPNSAGAPQDVRT